MRIILFLISLMLLTSCGNPRVLGSASVNGMATNAYQMKLQNGTDVWQIECPGSANSWGNCWARAQFLCENGFSLIDQNSNVGGGFAVITQEGGYASQRTERVATISCN